MEVETSSLAFLENGKWNLEKSVILLDGGNVAQGSILKLLISQNICVLKLSDEKNVICV